ncbi:MAG: hypothetical protein KIS91_15935, partial [Anaerolineae bacterium]|nr:hypothetical protein [Anaerolineae bacterium]
QGMVFSYGRRLAREGQPVDHLVVALNGGRATRVVAIDMAGYLPDGTVLKDVWGGSSHLVEAGALHLRLAPRSGVVLEVTA